MDDGQLITVGSAGGLLLAYQVMLRLDVISKDALDAWYQYYLTPTSTNNTLIEKLAKR